MDDQQSPHPLPLRPLSFFGQGRSYLVPYVGEDMANFLVLALIIYVPLITVKIYVRCFGGKAITFGNPSFLQKALAEERRHRQQPPPPQMSKALTLSACACLQACREERFKEE